MRTADDARRDPRPGDAWRKNSLDMTLTVIDILWDVARKQNLIQYVRVLAGMESKGIADMVTWQCMIRGAKPVHIAQEGD